MQFHLYGLILGIAIVLGWSAAERKAGTVYRNVLARCLMWICVGGLIGARVYHVATDWELYVDAGFLEYIAIWNGGLGIYGAIAGAVTGLVLQMIVSRSFSWLELWRRLDLVAVGAPLAQAVGRFGNYVNGELYGAPVPEGFPLRIAVPFPQRLPGFELEEYYHPLFIYEGLALVLVWMVLWRLSGWTRTHAFSRLKIGSGQVVGAYLVAYGSIRFLLEFLRLDSARIHDLPISIAQAFSLAVMVSGVVLLASSRWRGDSLRAGSPGD